MLLSLLLTYLHHSQTGVHPQFGPGRLIGHEALLASDRTSARMLDPETERWAVATVRGVGEYADRTMELDGERGAWPTFTIDLDVIDGWNVPKGAMRAFWWEGSASRRAVIGRMVGQNALVRFAPVRDGRFLLVGSDVTPAFEARPGESFVSILLPYAGTRLESGTPKYRGWASLWRAGLALDASAYQEFDRYMDASRLPLTLPTPYVERSDRNGRFLGDETPGEADAAWLFRIAKEGSPTFQMIAAEYLRRRHIQGALQTKRDLVLRSLREPDVFPNGLFQVGLDSDLFIGDNTSWLPVARVVDAVAVTRSATLAGDLLGLLIYKRLFAENRVRLLPLLTSQDVYIREQTLRAFTIWHGAPPAGTDPVAWHTARAKLSREALAAAKAAPGG